MQRKLWQSSVLSTFIALAALVGVVQAQAVDGGKADAFKSKTYTVKEKGKALVAVSFPAGKEAVVSERGAKKTDVHLFVFDSAKKQVAKDDSPGPNCDVKFTPKAAGTYTFEIDNLGPGDNDCTLKIDLK